LTAIRHCKAQAIPDCPNHLRFFFDQAEMRAQRARLNLPRLRRFRYNSNKTAGFASFIRRFPDGEDGAD